MVKFTKKQRHALYKKALRINPVCCDWISDSFNEGICVRLNNIVEKKHRTFPCDRLAKHFPELLLFSPDDYNAGIGYWWQIWDEEEQNQRTLALLLMIEMTKSKNNGTVGKRTKRKASKGTS